VRIGGQPATLVRIRLNWRLGPERAALLVREDERPFALIGAWAGGGALIGSEPVRVAAPRDDPFVLLDDQPAVAGNAGSAANAGDCEGVGGGWFGYLGYDLGRRIESLDAGPPIGAELPPFALAFYDHVLRLDRDGRWWFEALWTDGRAPALRSRLGALEARGARERTEREPFATAPWRSVPGAAGHELAVDACRRRIHAGDLFQANICQRLESRLAGAPIDLFVAAQTELKPDRAAFFAGPWGAVASLSPELFLERHRREVRSAPIKGTRSAERRDELLSSTKDRAENVMIVDLVRNDLGRVCVPGSIGVQSLARARAHTGVWHLVSEVGGVLRADVGDGELVRAAFPPGSVTGAPKVAALNVIAELESTGRGVYTGAIGFASPLAGLELSVAIRTFEFHGGVAHLGVGGGIVADSDPAAERQECMTKAAPLLAAIGAEFAPASGDAAASSDPALTRTAAPPTPLRRAPRPIPRPDPRAGVFETVLVADGRAHELDRHLARLARSVRELYGGALPVTLAEELTDALEGESDARLRVNARPRRRLTVDYELTPLAERRVPVALVPRTVAGGVGAHKWIDRRLLESLADEHGEPLLCDLDGFVLEAARANVFCVERGGRLLTPPTDGRILPGVTRARVLELAPPLGLIVAVEPLTLERLASAEELFVTGSLGGVEPAQLFGRPPSPSQRVAARLADALAVAELVVA
jgi:para-aminobenzoate synthetase/4-amino-4-deoxychorismate lyase